MALTARTIVLALSEIARGVVRAKFPFAHSGSFFVNYQKLYKIEQTTENGMMP
jgi:hypothetical protein